MIMSFERISKFVGIAAVMLLVAGIVWLFPSYKKVTRTLEVTTAELKVERSRSVSLEASISSMRESMSKSEVTGYVKEPVLVGGVVAYRTAFYRAKSESQVKETVAAALRSVMIESLSQSQSVSIHSGKEETIVKRSTFDLGLGFSTQSRLWVNLGVQVFGPYGVWAGAGVAKMPFGIREAVVGVRVER